METKEIGAGSYPEPKDVKTREVTLTCLFKTTIEVPEELENYCDIRDYVESCILDKQLLENRNEIIIEDIEK